MAEVLVPVNFESGETRQPMVNLSETHAARFSQLDSDRFGIRVARAQISSGALPQVMESCAEQKIDLLVARCAVSDFANIHALESHGFLLTDTLVYYSFDLARRSPPADTGEFPVRSLRPEDSEQVQAVAAAAFKGYVGHYHADRRLDRRKCDEAYSDWAARSCVPGLAADHALVAEHGGHVIGFATLRINSPLEVEGLLFAVAPEYQGRGVCRSFMIHSLEWTRSQGAQRMLISTQITNVSMQKVWTRVGFELRYSYYTFHKWFDR